MFVALTFTGTLPPYIVESIHQIRIYFDGVIYLIINDLQSPHLPPLVKYNVEIVDHSLVESVIFTSTVNKNIRKFTLIPDLPGREKLFIYSFERFFLLQNLMAQRNLEDGLFLELDNLIYDDPRKWLPEFSKHELCYMFDNVNRCSSGLMYVKQASSLNYFLDYVIQFIDESRGQFLDEMSRLYQYYVWNTSTVHILPTYWKKQGIPEMPQMNFGKYEDSIFDALSIGCFLLGLDPHHTKGVIVKGSKSIWGAIDYTKERFEWREDEQGRKKPYVWNGEKWLLINNLHVHSKDLKSGLSLPL